VSANAAVYELEDAAVLGPDGPIVDDLSFRLDDHAVTVVLGPAGTGKSSLLVALSGRHLPLGLGVAGRWRFRGRVRPGWAHDRIVYVRQRRPGIASLSWQQGLELDGDTVLLDEPCASPDEADQVPALVDGVRAYRDRGAVVLVTHDLEIARAVADHVCLVVAGRLEGPTPAATFFTAPPSELAARFLAQGNCWPRNPLPSHFHWVRPGLAGMGRPGLLGDLDTDLDAIAAHGVELLVSLTEEPPPVDALRARGIASRHVPIPDMNVPSLAAMTGLAREIGRARGGGVGVAVHCHAGLGRTGAVLAAFLVATGAAPDDAVVEVRRAIRGAIQSRIQLQFVYRFAETLTGGPS